MSTSTPPAPPASETGQTGLFQLKRLWHKLVFDQVGDYPDEQQLDSNLISMLGIGLLPLYEFTYTRRPDFPAFEAWVAAHHAPIPEALVARCNALVTGIPATAASAAADVLTPEDLAHWAEHGYVIVRNAISAADCAATRALIWDFLGMQEADPESWYRPHESLQGIMVTLYQHPLLSQNRHNATIRRAYEQLWGTQNLIVTADKVGFNPPERPDFRYRGAGMHWDVSLARPIPFGTQGILYLTDTAEHGGALRLVPGFQRQLDAWLNALPPERHPRQERWEAPAVKHIAANAGDFIIWHHTLPHDGSPNTAVHPRMVQYFNWLDPSVPVQQDWL